MSAPYLISPGQVAWHEDHDREHRDDRERECDAGDVHDDRLRPYLDEAVFQFAVLCLAGLSAAGLGAQAGELEYGFIQVWTQPVIVYIAGIAFTLTIISVFSIMILMDARENAYCVPMERSASLLAGIGGAWILHWGWQQPAPTGMEMLGALFLIAAIVVLSVAPRMSARTGGGA